MAHMQVDILSDTVRNLNADNSSQTSIADYTEIRIEALKEQFEEVIMESSSSKLNITPTLKNSLKKRKLFQKN